MAGKADIRRRVQVGDKLVVIKYDTPFPSKVKVGDIRTVRSVSARLVTWDGILDGQDVTGARTELGADTVVTWHGDDTFQVAYDEGPTVMLRIVPKYQDDEEPKSLHDAVQDIIDHQGPVAPQAWNSTIA